jgi:hypothetical protein
MNPLASVAIGRSFFSLTGGARAWDRRVSRLAADGRCFWQERLRKKRHRAKRGGIAAQRRQVDNDRSVAATPASLP